MYTPTIIPTSTRIPTATRLIATPTRVKSRREEEVEDFIVYYWGLISAKEFSVAYRYLTESFKSEFKIESLSKYADGFKYTDHVDVISVKITRLANTEAVVEALVGFYSVYGDVIEYNHRYYLVKEDGIWKFNMSEKIRK
ncbi:MAG: hypothetical protein QXL91_06975 [Candidatus Bathyarchaeia archaeon]